MTQTELQTELLKILWTVLDRKDYTAETGEQVCILQPGEYDPENDRFCSAEIRPACQSLSATAMRKTIL